MSPETKKIVVIDATTGNEIKDVAILSFSSEQGNLAFNPETVPGNYYVYYLPYQYRTRSGSDLWREKPWNDYLPSDYETHLKWEEQVKKNQSAIPFAIVERFESRSQFDKLY